MVVEGHCDDRGTIEYNISLGGRRAATVRDYLVTLLGSPPFPVATVSFGEERPLVPNATSEEDHAHNRRAVLLLDCGSR